MTASFSKQFSLQVTLHIGGGGWGQFPLSAPTEGVGKGCRLPIPSLAANTYCSSSTQDCVWLAALIKTKYCRITPRHEWPWASTPGSARLSIRAHGLDSSCKPALELYQHFDWDSRRSTSIAS